MCGKARPYDFAVYQKLTLEYLTLNRWPEFSSVRIPPQDAAFSESVTSVPTTGVVPGRAGLLGRDDGAQRRVACDEIRNGYSNWSSPRPICGVPEKQHQEGLQYLKAEDL